MRIIQGKFNNRKIFLSKNSSIRPTTDRTRESIFNILYSQLKNNFSEYNFLDLCAGSGAFGIEALSRGAKFCLFVDNNTESIKTIRYNLQNLSADNSTYQIIKNNVCNLQLTNYRPDIIFIDPPYDIAEVIIENTLTNLLNQQLIDKNTIIICESSNKKDLNINIHNLEIYDQRNYGYSKVSFIKLL
jgi:16S rRNA (guanine966-N2)-methyltransferase